MTLFIPYDPAAPKSKKRLRTSKENLTPRSNSVKRPRISSTSNTMATAPITGKPTETVDIHARLDPSARMRLALEVLDVGGLSITKLLMFRLGSSETSHFKNAFLSEDGGLEKFLNELVEQYPASEDCIARAVGHHITLKKVSAEMELVKTHTLFSSTDVTPRSMRNWTVGIPEHLVPFLSSILRASAVSDRAAKENKTKRDTFTVSSVDTHI